MGCAIGLCSGALMPWGNARGTEDCTTWLGSCNIPGGGGLVISGGG